MIHRAAALFVLAAGAAIYVYARRPVVSGGSEVPSTAWNYGNDAVYSALATEPPGAEVYIDPYSGSDLVTEPPVVAGALEEAADAIFGAVNDATLFFTGLTILPDTRWIKAAMKPENAKYVQAAQQAEQRHGMPTNMVVRQIWQESRFDPKAFNKGSGATGIMQIVPRWHPNVDAADPIASIAYGAAYDAQLFARFGSWERALQAYNWGPDSLRKHLAGGKGAPSMPLETRNYSAQILADINAQVIV